MELLWYVAELSRLLSGRSLHVFAGWIKTDIKVLHWTYQNDIKLTVEEKERYHITNLRKGLPNLLVSHIENRLVNTGQSQEKTSLPSV